MSGTFEQLAIISNLSALGLYFLSAIGVWVLRKRNVRGEGEPFRIAGGPTVPILACILVAWVISQTITTREFIAFGVVLVFSIVVYFVRKRAVK